MSESAKHEKSERIGRGAAVNPHNRFFQARYVSEHPEGIDETEQEESSTRVIEVFPKTIINPIISPDVGMEQSVNPYQGCEHGCAYCYARNSHEYWGYSAGADFESVILVKKNAPQLLEEALRKEGYVPKTITLSGNTDCYQPLERRFELTRRCLEVMDRYNHPVAIITKNYLVTRDADILERLAKRNLVRVTLSVTTRDKELRLRLEPRTSTFQRRIEAIATLTERGVPVNVMCAPIIPGLNSHEVVDLVGAAAQAGARSVGFTMVRLNGQLFEIFDEWLKRNYPDRYNKVIELIKQTHGGKVNDSEWGRRMKGSGPFAESIHQAFAVARRKYGLHARRDELPLSTHLFAVPPRTGDQLALF